MLSMTRFLPEHVGKMGNGHTRDNGEHSLLTVSKDGHSGVKPIRMQRRRRSSSSDLSMASMTPSMCSVMSQVKQNRRRRTTSTSSDSSKQSLEPPCASASSVSSSYRATESSRRARTLSDDFFGDWFGSLGCDAVTKAVHHGTEHPLEVSMSLDSALLSEEPRVKVVNLPDLNFSDQYRVSDIVQFYTPVFQRRKRSKSRRTSVDLTIDTTKRVGTAQVSDVYGSDTLSVKQLASVRGSSRASSPLIYEKDIVEMEHWPTQESDTQESTDSAANYLWTDRPLKRTRQQSLNPNFLKLYALETSCKSRNTIPDLNVDEQVLRRLSYDDIWALDIPAASQNQGVSAYDIKIALITRKKLWSEMLSVPRSDLHGASSPWNLKFIASSQNETASTSSLVRVKSDLKPWTGQLSSLMLRPCGKLALDKSRPGSCTREIQYVVKGWCDSRFVN